MALYEITGNISRIALTCPNKHPGFVRVYGSDFGERLTMYL